MDSLSVSLTRMRGFLFGSRGGAGNAERRSEVRGRRVFSDSKVANNAKDVKRQGVGEGREFLPRMARIYTDGVGASKEQLDLSPLILPPLILQQTIFNHHCAMTKRFRCVTIVLCIMLTTAGGASYAYWRIFLRDPLGAYRTYRGHHETVNSVAFDATGELITTAGEDMVAVWKVNDLQSIVRSPAKALASRFLATPGSLAYAEKDRGIVLYDFLQSPQQRVLGRKTQHVVMAVSRDCKWIAASFSPQFLNPPKDLPPETFAIYVWNMEQPDRAIVLTGHEGPVMALAFHPHKPVLLSFGHDDTDRAWDYTTGAQLSLVGGVVPLAKQLSFIDSHVVLEISSDGEQVLRSNHLTPFVDWSELHLLIGQRRVNMSAGAFFPDNKRFVAGDTNGMLSIWDVATRRILVEFPANRNGSRIFGVAVSPDGKLIASCGEGRIGGFDALAKSLSDYRTVWLQASVVQIEERIAQSAWRCLCPTAHR